MGRGIRLSTPTSENDNYSPATICVPRAISINREDASAEEVRWRQSRWVRGGFEDGSRRKEQSDRIGVIRAAKLNILSLS